MIVPVIVEVSSALHNISVADKFDIINSSGSLMIKDSVVTSHPEGELTKFASWTVIEYVPAVKPLNV